MRLRTLLLCLACTPVLADSLRCGRALVSTGDHAGEVLEKCGEPNRRSQISYRQSYGYYGELKETYSEEWVYGPRNGMYYYLRLDGDRLTRIDSRRGN
ncbi:TPA: DUF2845 domain-containing protein [Klebsiella pneumoniae]